ncbi:Uncharacterised protein [Bordetella pertussis]|nr:Uncharacterised protein [Bordetella pertussis]CFT86295.1 Uncharacterised protein [Bordetella pertussis]
MTPWDSSSNPSSRSRRPKYCSSGLPRRTPFSMTIADCRALASTRAAVASTICRCRALSVNNPVRPCAKHSNATHASVTPSNGREFSLRSAPFPRSNHVLMAEPNHAAARDGMSRNPTRAART